MKNLIGLGIILLSLAGCGGGGGGGGGGDATTPPNTTPVTMTLKVSTTGTLPAGTSLSGVGFTVTLPAGVTAATDQSGGVTAGVVVTSGLVSSATATSTQTYTPAVGATPAKLDITVASIVAGGFGTGEFVSITVTRPAGSAVPTSADFPLSNFAPADLLYGPVAGISGLLTVQ